jgi:uncharacterized protein involved in response to NO
MLVSVNMHHDQYPNVLQLNNLGVDLMEANSFQSAAAALREAIHVVKDVIRPVQDNPCYEQTLSRSNEAVFACTKRLLEAKNLPPFNLGELHGLGMPLRMKAIHTRTGAPLKQSPEMTTAILLFNFGLLNRWAGTQHKCDASVTLKESAVKLLTMSLSVLAGRTCIAHTDAEHMTEVRLYLLIKVLNVVSQIEVELGKHDDANAHMQQLENLARVAFFKFNFGNAIHQPAAPAA